MGSTDTHNYESMVKS